MEHVCLVTDCEAGHIPDKQRVPKKLLYAVRGLLLLGAACFLGTASLTALLVASGLVAGAFVGLVAMLVWVQNNAI